MNVKVHYSKIPSDKISTMLIIPIEWVPKLIIEKLDEDFDESEGLINGLKEKFLWLNETHQVIVISRPTYCLSIESVNRR